METYSPETEESKATQVASIIRSGINGNKLCQILHTESLSAPSLLLLEVELMETSQGVWARWVDHYMVASIIRSGINGNGNCFIVTTIIHHSHRSLLLLEVELMETKQRSSPFADRCQESLLLLEVELMETRPLVACSRELD